MAQRSFWEKRSPWSRAECAPKFLLWLSSRKNGCINLSNQAESF